ncbi:alpha-hydroxy acid oxidase [Shimia sp.]|uniref:alpha-hydroxy acid oxidase n=1 Tax=Shimia sp. TaxID=1954381 RepID=UPI003B8E8E3D
MNLHAKYPAVSDLRSHAKRRVPKFIWEYLDSATGDERTKARNRDCLDDIRFAPSILHGEIQTDLSTEMLGHKFPLPIGVAPVGMSGLVWPHAEKLLAQAAATAGIPYCLSTVATQTPEDLAPDIGEHAWFQMYPPRDEDIRADLLRRAKASGFSTLVITVDVPVASRRERQVRSGLQTPPKLTPRLLAQIATCPTWAIGMAQAGMPRMRLIDEYAGEPTALSSTAHAGYLLRTSPDWNYVTWLRDNWQGNFVVKGVMREDAAAKLESVGVDAIWVSNHAGRQFDAAPATIEILPQVRAACDVPIIIDSGFETGLDVLRAKALGADFVFLGRGFHYALAALGAHGPAHLIDILAKDIEANMGQMGARTLVDVADNLL